jgi:hypothetical protein
MYDNHKLSIGIQGGLFLLVKFSPTKQKRPIPRMSNAQIIRASRNQITNVSPFRRFQLQVNSLSGSLIPESSLYSGLTKVTIPTVLRAFRPTTLQIFCAVGFFYGVTMLVHTIRQRRSRLKRPESRIAKAPNLSRELVIQQNRQPTASSGEVIRLSPGSRTLNASNMTQQQKIAAALLKAGSANSPSWYDSDPSDPESRLPVRVISAHPPPSSDREGIAREYTLQDANTEPAWKTYLTLAITAALTLLSLYFFIKSLR